MWENIAPDFTSSVDEVDNEDDSGNKKKGVRREAPAKGGMGCVLAHAMGLGKTLQIVTLVQGYCQHEVGTHVLIIVPVNTIRNW